MLFVAFSYGLAWCFDMSNDDNILSLSAWMAPFSGTSKESNPIFLFEDRQSVYVCCQFSSITIMKLEVCIFLPFFTSNDLIN